MKSPSFCASELIMVRRGFNLLVAELKFKLKLKFPGIFDQVLVPANPYLFFSALFRTLIVLSALNHIVIEF